MTLKTKTLKSGITRQKNKMDLKEQKFTAAKDYGRGVTMLWLGLGEDIDNRDKQLQHYKC